MYFKKLSSLRPFRSFQEIKKIAKMPANHSEVINTDFVSSSEESVSLFFLSLALSTFYQKIFPFKSQGAFLISCFAGYFIWGWDSLGLSSFVVVSYKIFTMLFTVTELSHDIKILDLQDLFNILLHLPLYCTWLPEKHPDD